MNCPHCGGEISPAKMMRAIPSEARAKASKENAKKGWETRRLKQIVKSNP